MFEMLVGCLSGRVSEQRASHARPRSSPPAPPTSRHRRYPPFYGDDPLMTCRKILCYKETLQFPPEAALTPEAEHLVRHLCSRMPLASLSHGATI